MDELKKQAEELGIKVDGRWSAERLQDEIDDKLGAEPELVIETPVTQQEPAVDPVGDPEAPVDAVEPEPEPEPEPEVEAVESITIINLTQNPMRAFGLKGFGSSVVLTRVQLNDEAFVAKVERAEEFGMIKAE